MVGGIGGLVGDTGKKYCLVILYCSVGVHGVHVYMEICIIFWLVWYIFVHSEVISASLA